MTVKLTEVFILREGFDLKNPKLEADLGPKYAEEFKAAVEIFRDDWYREGENPDDIYYGDDYCMHHVTKDGNEVHIHFNERVGGNACGDWHRNADGSWIEEEAEFVVDPDDITNWIADTDFEEA